MMFIETVNLNPGMILGKPVHNGQGQLLVNTGSKLSEKDIHKFKTWGVSKVAIRGNTTVIGTNEVLPEIDVQESIEAELREKFFGVLDDPVMIEIMDTAKKQLLKTHRKQELDNERA